VSKKIIILFTALLFTINSYASSYEYSQRGHSGGFEGPRATHKLVDSVNSIGITRINSYVLLEGFLINQIKEDYYTFKDDTGEITVEIYYRYFRNQTITPKTKIRIQGEVDRKWNKTYIYVNYLEIIK